MDRWHIEFSKTDDEAAQGDPIPSNIINNYFSIGVVSFILGFHRFRLTIFLSVKL